ncbi:MAG TPA: hypothetical protein VHV31_13300 [Nitrolancea sp.]|nr:hypothetical protein [Nitrolancea sp.]
MKRKKVVIIALVVVVLIAVIAAFVAKVVLVQDQIVRPTAPPSVSAIRSSWSSVILLPTFVPVCLTYGANGTSIKDDPTARGGKALDIQLVSTGTAACNGAQRSDVTITQAPALESLSGEVRTLTDGRMQFARQTEAVGAGQTKVTLQWHCLVNVMCRITGTTGDLITEDVLSRMADSFEIIKPAA